MPTSLQRFCGCRVMKHTASGHIPVAAKLGKMIRYRLDDVLAALKKETSMSE